MMNAAVEMVLEPMRQRAAYDNSDRARYERCIKTSKRVRWDIDADVFRGRSFDFSRKFLPDGLSKVNEVPFLTPDERRMWSQVQGRTYPAMFGMAERFIGAKTLELASAHRLEDSACIEGLVRFTDEELKHQELFRRMESSIATRLPSGYAFLADPNEVARRVLKNSTWSVLALICHVELFTQVHYRESIEPDDQLSDLYRDIFRYHWLEECQHTVMDEIEWRREDETLTLEQRDHAVDELIALLLSVDAQLRQQSSADAGYFLRACERNFTVTEQKIIRDTMLKAYRWQYIGSGLKHPHFRELLASMITPAQMIRIDVALHAIVE
jgi:hypothetical protein